MRKSIQYLVIVVTVFFSPDTLLFGTSGDKLLMLLNQILFTFLIFFLSNNYPNFKDAKFPNFIICSFALIIFTTSLINLDFSNGYIIQLNSLLLGYFIAKKIEFQTFATNFNNVLYYLSLISVFFFTLFNYYPNLIYLFDIKENISGTNFINLYFYVHFIDVFRNTGIFREPGVYMIYLNLAILFELFVSDIIDRKKIFIFVIALITTLSTAGFIICIFLSIIYFMNKKSLKIGVILLFSAIVILFFVSNNYEYFEAALTKFDSKSNEYGSAVARISSITIPISIYLDSPFFGVGLYSYINLYKFYSSSILGFSLNAESQSTNTLLNALATYGPLYFIFFILAFYKLAKLISKKFLIRLTIFLLFTLMLSNEDIRYSLLFTTLIFFGYFEKNKSNKVDSGLKNK